MLGRLGPTLVHSNGVSAGTRTERRTSPRRTNGKPVESLDLFRIWPHNSICFLFLIDKFKNALF